MLYGNLYATRGIADQMEKDKQFEQEVLNAFHRYTRYDWGDLCASDKAINDAAVEGADRVLAAYHTSAGVIWIITEWDRSATTILFPNEY